MRALVITLSLSDLGTDRAHTDNVFGGVGEVFPQTIAAKTPSAIRMQRDVFTLVGPRLVFKDGVNV